MTQTMDTPVRPVRRSVPALALLTLVGGLVLAATPTQDASAATAPPAPLLTTADTTWKYLDDNTDPGTPENLLSWTQPAYDASAWKSAKGSFGAKGGKLAAVGPHTPTTLLTQYIEGTTTDVPTFFFRSTFEFDADTADELEKVVGNVVYDDGLVVYVNGAKVAGFHDERVTSTTTNLQYAGSGASDPVAASFDLDPEALLDGTNTIAVALYQDRASSSDVYFDLTSLTPVAEDAPVVVAPPTRVILTPTETPETSQSISWLAGSEADTTGQVEIRPASGGATRTLRAYAAGAVNGNAKQHFSVTVPGLKPATEYSYRVGVPGAWTGWKTFGTADPAETDFSFIYYGDAQIGLDSTWPKVVAQAQATAPDAIGSVHAGDLIDSASNETQWVNWFKGMEDAAATSNVMAAPGNHEYSGDKKLAAWKANFEYPLNNPTTETVGELAQLAVGDTPVARQYAAYFAHWSEFAAETVYFTDYQGMRFITINATRDTAFLTPDALPACTGTDCPQAKVAELWTQFQAAWLDTVLTESPSKWNVVTFHQPVYSTSSGRDEPVLRKYWVPVFQEHDIDLVMMGHDHTYARGYNDEDRTDTEGVTDGPVYIVSNSGAKHYDLAAPDKNVWTNNGATQVLRGEKITTYQVVDVTADTLTYKSYIAEKVAGASTDLPVGAVYDEFTVTKRDDGTKWVTEAGVAVPSEVTFTTQPAAATTVESGKNVTISSTAVSTSTATPALRVAYQWQTAAAGTDAWTDIAGATSKNLLLKKVSATTDQHRYRVVATAGKSSTTSAVSTVTVTKAPTTLKLAASSLRTGAKPRVTANASVAGTVEVTVVSGIFLTTASVPVAKGSTTTVTLPQSLPFGVSGATVQVTATLTPTDSVEFAGTTAEFTTKIG